MNHKTSGRARKLLFLLIVASVICSCATSLSKEASLVREAREYSVEGCEFLGTVQGWSGWGERAEGVGIQNAKNQALERAASLGATHIVWVDIRGGVTPVTRARAYNCGQREEELAGSSSPEVSNVAGKGKSEKATTTAGGTLAKEKLAVMDLKAKHGVKESLAEGLSVVIRDTIQGFGNYEVISKEDVEAVAERTAIRQSLGCDDTKCLINIGRSLGTRYMVAGALSKFGDTYNVSLRLIDTKGQEAGVKKRINRNCDCAEDELIEIAQVTAYLLLGRYSLQIYNSGQLPQSGKAENPRVANVDFVSVKETEKQLPEERKQKLAYVPKTATREKVSLRTEPKQLSEKDIRKMLARYDFYDDNLNWRGSFANDLVDNGDGTITDKATGLMWQKSGSAKAKSWRRAKLYADDLNRHQFAGYSDWRLPTIDELASLLEKSKKDGLHIDPVFDRKQERCWSKDSRPESNLGYGQAGLFATWIGHFPKGRIIEAKWTYKFKTDLAITFFEIHPENYVRLVRSLRR